MDAFDDFEMKPLTKGLGFHKKTQDLSESIIKSELVKKQIPRTVPTGPSEKMRRVAVDSAPTYEDLLADLNRTKKIESISPRNEMALNSSGFGTQLENQLKISETLPREQDRRSLSVENTFVHEIDQNSAPVSEISIPPVKEELDIPSIFDKTLENHNFDSQAPVEGTRRGAHDGLSGRLEPVAFSFSAVVLDFMVVLAMSLVFLVSLLWATQVDLVSVFANATADLATQVSLVVLYVAVYQMYVIVTRSFFGRTLGEWTFDHQLGDDKQHKSSMYPLLVVWRSLLIVGTGVFLLPVLSILFRRDIASYLTGLQLYRERQSR